MEMEILDEKPSCLSKQYQTLNVIISTGQSKEYLGRSVSAKDLDAMSQDELDAYYKIYELNYANKIGEGIVNSIIGVYAKAINKILPIDDVKKLETDLNSDYILTHELKNIMCPVARTFGKLMSLFSLSFITLKHVKIQCEEICENKELCKEQ
jgi:hypothetical protein